MNNRSTVKCNDCQSTVVPELNNLNESNFITERKTEHICPICGATMFMTGGEATKEGKILGYLLFFGWLLYFLINGHFLERQTLIYMAIGIVALVYIKKKGNS